MPSYAAFLRAINTGGHKVTMERLRALVGELGFEDVATVINSGNVLFRTGDTGTRKLESRIESHLNEALGFESTTFVRTAAEVARIASHEPFPGGERGDSKLHVMFLHKAPTAAVKRRALALATDEDQLAVPRPRGLLAAPREADGRHHRQRRAGPDPGRADDDAHRQHRPSHRRQADLISRRRSPSPTSLNRTSSPASA